LLEAGCGFEVDSHRGSVQEKGAASEMALVWCVEHGVFRGSELDKSVSLYTKLKSGKKEGAAAKR